MAKKEKPGESAKELALMFKTLGDPTRVRIFRYLRNRCWPVTVEDGEDKWMAAGPTVGDVCRAVSGSKKITAKVSHHLKEMRLAGLIAINRQGKTMVCGVSQKSIDALSGFLASTDAAPLTDDASGEDIPEIEDILEIVEAA
ncbi:MAG: helix-turn-helix domain-containing protein [Capsulimonas sp.]|uniref:ArsR/SmtB family transcription factor n=1 Tax=Capsulimonas sp. TaxID=2494211 RepID=UPI0032670A0E